MRKYDALDTTFKNKIMRVNMTRFFQIFFSILLRFIPLLS